MVAEVQLKGGNFGSRGTMASTMSGAGCSTEFDLCLAMEMTAHAHIPLACWNAAVNPRHHRRVVVKEYQNEVFLIFHLSMIGAPGAPQNG